MGTFEFYFEQYSWQKKLKLEDIILGDDKLICQADNYHEAALSVHNVLDLIAFYQEKDLTARYLGSGEIFERELLTSGEGVIEQSQESMAVFLAEAYSRYSDLDFRESTGINWIVRYYLSALGIPLFQTRFLSYFAALELLLAHLVPPAAEGPLAGLVQAVRKIPSIPSKTRDIAAERLAAPSLAERMVEFVRLTGIKGVTFQASYEEHYRFDELLRLRDEFRQKGFSPRFGKIDSNVRRFGNQLKALVRESIYILVTQI